MDAKAALKERTELFYNAFQFKRNKRIPLAANINTWKVLDAGHTISEAIYDYNLMEKIVEDFHRKYQFDAYEDVGSTNPMMATRALGGGFFKIAPTDDAIVVGDHHIMEQEDYRELVKNPMNFYYSKAFKRYCKSGITVGEIGNSVKEFCDFVDYVNRISDKLNNQYGAMKFTLYNITHPFDALFCILRGIRNTSLDVRRCKTQMKEAMDAMFAAEVEPMFKTFFETDYTGFIAPVMISFLGHSTLSVSQFEELYWPYVKKTMDMAVKYNKPVYSICESEMLRFSEFFQDIPKGILLFHLEQDDIFEIRKKLPNIALAGGMPLDLLGHGTKKECVDYAKKLIDTMGDGFVLSQNKSLCYHNDAKRENVLAVNEFARTYQY
jgi:hypothetical protein